jgi:hypothetical protein
MPNPTAQQFPNVKQVFTPPVPLDNNAFATGAGGSDLVLTITADPKRGIAVKQIDYAYTVATTTGAIKVTDGTNTWGPFPVLAGGLLTKTFDPPLVGKANANMVITMTDGGQTKSLYVTSFVVGGVLV